MTDSTTSIAPKRRAFLEDVATFDPARTAEAEAILGVLERWSAAQVPPLVPLYRENDQNIVQYGIEGTDRIIWAARTFRTTGARCTGMRVVTAVSFGPSGLSAVSE